MILPASKEKGFTLIESVFATLLFAILISATFAIFRYMGQATEESRSAIRIAQQLENNVTILRALIRHNGWEPFLQNYFLPPNSYTLTTTPPFIAVSPTTPIAEGEWRVSLSADPDLGPYLSGISLSGTTYTLTFSSPVYAKLRDPNQAIPILSSSSARWRDETTTFANTPSGASTSVTIVSSAGQISALGGQRLKPTSSIVDIQERSDTTASNGVVIPAAAASPTIGYPSVIRARFQTMIGGTSLTYATTLHAE